MKGERTTIVALGLGVVAACVGGAVAQVADEGPPGAPTGLELHSSADAGWTPASGALLPPQIAVEGDRVRATLSVAGLPDPQWLQAHPVEVTLAGTTLGLRVVLVGERAGEPARQQAVQAVVEAVPDGQYELELVVLLATGEGESVVAEHRWRAAVTHGRTAPPAAWVARVRLSPDGRQWQDLAEVAAESRPPGPPSGVRLE